MNIVFFVDSYSKNASACGICIKKVADELSSQGHRVYVITSITQANQPKYEIVNGVNVYRIFESSVSAFKLFIEKRKNKKTWKKLLIYYIRFRYLFLLWFWPLTSFFAPTRYANYAKKQLKENKPDVIIGTFYHIEQLLASMKLRKKYPNAVQISYLLDAMTDVNTPVFFKKPEIAKKSVNKWIKSILNNSDLICPMISHKSFYENYNLSKNILDKIKYMGIPTLDLNNSYNQVENRETKKIVYTGYSTRESGSAKYLVELMPYLKNVEVHFYGDLDKEILDAIEKTGLSGKSIFFHGRVDYSIATTAQNDADFLVNFSGINPYMVSSKVFDYMSKKKPIISFYNAENHADLYYINKYPNAIAIKENIDDYASNAAKLSAFLERNDFVHIEDDFLKQVFYNNTPEAMAELILNLPRYSNE